MTAARRSSFALLLAAPLAAASGQSQVVCLVSLGDALYRSGPGGVETFPNQPGQIVGMTVVPPGASVAGCRQGDVMAVENADGGRIWRIDNASAGTPALVEVGHLPGGVGVTDLALAHGRLFGIGWGAVFYEFSPVDFAQVGEALNLQPTTAGVGGLTFDGAWYVTNGNTDRLVRIDDPPSQATWTPVGSVGLDFDNSDLELHAGRVWGAVRSPPTPAGRLLIGSFSTQTGAFAVVRDVIGAPAQLPIGLAVLSAVCYADCDASEPTPALNVNDLVCFQSRFAAADPYADCDRNQVLSVGDFVCFLSRFAAACP
jgi:hypothetical protein